MGSIKTADTVTPNHDTSSGVKRRKPWSADRRQNTYPVYHNCPVRTITSSAGGGESLEALPQKRREWLYIMLPRADWKPRGANCRFCPTRRNLADTKEGTE